MNPLSEQVLEKIFSNLPLKDLQNCTKVFPQFTYLLFSLAANKIKYFYLREKQRRKERYEDKIDHLLNRNYTFCDFGLCCICGRNSSNPYIVLAQDHKLKSLCSSCLNGEKSSLCVCLT
nr:putative membrane protein [Cedratvirus duvanny]